MIELTDKVRKDIVELYKSKPKDYFLNMNKSEIAKELTQSVKYILSRYDNIFNEIGIPADIRNNVLDNVYRSILKDFSNILSSITFATGIKVYHGYDRIADEMWKQGMEV